MIEEIQITQYKVGDRIFDTKEQAEKYDNEGRIRGERLKKLSIDNIDIPQLLYNDLNNNILAKADTGFRFFVAYNKSDLNFLYSCSRPNPFLTGIVTRQTPCIVGINLFRHLFITSDVLIERGEELSDKFHQYDNELAEMEKQITDLEIKLGVK